MNNQPLNSGPLNAPAAGDPASGGGGARFTGTLDRVKDTVEDRGKPGHILVLKVRGSRNAPAESVRQLA